jgi:hypothetical protein
MEKVYIIEKVGENYKITDIVSRTHAEANNLCHLTTICLPFIIDGGEDVKGRWVAHDRYHKLVAKGKACPEKIFQSFNLFGGHTTPPDNTENLIGTFIDEAILYDGLRKELMEEILQRTDEGSMELEVWEKGIKTGNLINAMPYPVSLFTPIPIGFAEYADKNNTEYSFVFALPIKHSDYKKLIAADDYEQIDEKHNISLPLELFSEDELVAMMNENNPNIEICDAITRLFLLQNSDTLEKLREVVKIG